MSDPERVPPSGGPGHWRRWLLPVLASAAWLVLTFCLYRHAVQGEQAHLLELCHTRLAATPENAAGLGSLAAACAGALARAEEALRRDNG